MNDLFPIRPDATQAFHDFSERSCESPLPGGSMLNSDTYALVAQLQRALHSHVQCLRLRDLKAQLPAVTQIAWESDQPNRFNEASEIVEIRLQVGSNRGPVWISVGGGDIDAQLDRFVESLERAAGLEAPSVEAALATTTRVLGLPTNLDTWKKLAALAQNYVENCIEGDGCIEIGQHLKELSDDDLHCHASALSDPLAAAKATAAGLLAESYLIASTGHVTEEERDLFNAGQTPSPYMVVSLNSDHGWLIHLSEALPEVVPALSEGLATVVRHARAHNLHYIRFDSDGPVVSGAKTYVW